VSPKGRRGTREQGKDKNEGSRILVLKWHVLILSIFASDLCWSNLMTYIDLVRETSESSSVPMPILARGALANPHRGDAAGL